MAKLSKEQILFIENYLIEQGVKYWDVRAELIDHSASKLEENPNLILTRTFMILEFGSSISLNKILDSKRELLTKKYQYHALKEIKNIFFSLQKRSIFFALLFLLMTAFFKLHNSFLTWLVAGFGAILLVILGFLRMIQGARNLKSLQVESTLQFTVWFAIMAQLFAQGHLYDTVFWFKGAVFIFLIIYYLLFYGGMMVHNRIKREYHGFYKKLNTV
jgi:hypothetical protein